MRTTLSALAVASLLTAVGVCRPEAATIVDVGLVQANEALNSYTDVRNRRYVRRYYRALPWRYYAGPYPYSWGSPAIAYNYNDAYDYYPYYPRYYAPGTYFSFGY